MKKQKPQQRTSRRQRTAEAAVGQYEASEGASDIAVAIAVMRLASEARRRDLSQLFQSGAYHRLSASSARPPRGNAKRKSMDSLRAALDALPVGEE